MKIIENDNINDLIDKKCFKLFYFTATWCGPCKRIKPSILKLSEGLDESKIVFYQVDIDNNDELSSKYEINSVPSFVLLDNNNNEIDRCSGSNIKILGELLAKNLK